MQQQFWGVFLFVSLGVAGIALSQPKVVSWGTTLLGIHFPVEAVEPESADEIEMYPPEPNYDNSDSWEITADTETPAPVYRDYPIAPMDEALPVELVEPEPISDFAFGELSIPLVAEITTATATVIPPAFEAVEEDFAALSRDLTPAEPPLPDELLEEIVLYEPPQLTPGEPQQSADEPAKTRRAIAAPPSGHGNISLVRNPLPEPVNPPQNLQAAGTGTNSRFHVDANLVEIVPLPGAETVARVGTEIILGCDILPAAKKAAYFQIREGLKALPPEERQKISAQEIRAQEAIIIQQAFPAILEQYVHWTLVYCDIAGNGQKEMIQMFEKRLGDSFEEKELPKLMKQFEAGSRLELNSTLERLIGSSIEREKAFYVRQAFGEIMKGNAIQEAEGECTHDEMLNYYNEHKADFFHRARARWLQLTVNITSSLPKEEAGNKIVWMGNQVAGGVPFEQVARDHSDGLMAKSGGLNDWVRKGSLVSDKLEQAVFQCPIGALSPIIEDRNAFHIIKVLEREDEYYTPFLQSQLKIKEKIKELRRNKKEAEYFVELFRKFQPETYQNNVTSFSRSESKTALPQGTGTSLHAL